MRNLMILCVLPGLISMAVQAQSVEYLGTDSAHFQIPDIPGYYTLKCDFHNRSRRVSQERGGG